MPECIYKTRRFRKLGVEELELLHEGLQDHTMDGPEAICDTCHAPKGLHAVGQSCNNNCGGRVVATPATNPAAEALMEELEDELAHQGENLSIDDKDENTDDQLDSVHQDTAPGAE